MHINWIEVIGGLATFYMSAHASSRAWVPMLPKPAQIMGSRWYPAVYAFLVWWAAGNGPAPADSAPQQKVEPDGKPTV
jgi:hypothetical protein